MHSDIVNRDLAEIYLSHGQYDRRTLSLIHATQDKLWCELSANKIPVPSGQIKFLDQIVGAGAGVGKSQYAHELLKHPYHAAHSVVIDPDDLRKRNKLFNETIKDAMEAGFGFLDADRLGMQKWQPACISIMINIMNFASAKGYGILRTGRISGNITDSVCENAEEAGFYLRTTLVHAPLNVRKESVDRRVAKGGHPADIFQNYEQHDPIKNVLSHLFTTSNEVELRWRGHARKSSIPVARAEKGAFTCFDNAGLNSLVAAFGKANAGEAVAYFEAVHAQAYAKRVRTCEPD